MIVTHAIYFIEDADFGDELKPPGDPELNNLENLLANVGSEQQVPAGERFITEDILIVLYHC